MPSLLWLIVAFLAGLLVEWLLEIFFFRRSMFEQAAAERARHEQTLGEWGTKNTALQATLNNRDKELSAARAANAKLQVNLETCAGARASLEQDSGSLKERASQLEAELRAAAQTRNALETDLKIRDAEFTRVRADLDSHLIQNKNLAVDVARLAAGAATAAATIQTLEGDKAGLTGQVADLKAQLARAKADLDTSISAQASANKQTAELQVQFTTANADLNSSLQARTQLEADLHAREAELAQLRATVDTHLEQNRTLRTDIAHLSEGAAASATTIKVLESEKAGLSAQVADLKAQLSVANADLNAAIDVKAGMDKQLVEQRARLDQAQTDLNAALSLKSSTDQHLADIMTQLDKANTDLIVAAEVKAGLDKQLADVKSQLDRARIDASASLQTSAKLESDLTVRDAELAHLHASLDNHVAQNRLLTADIASLTEGAATATATIKALEGAKSQLQDQVGRLQAELSACMNARMMLEADLQARNVAIEKLRMPPTPPPVLNVPAPAPAMLPPFSRKEYAAQRNRSADDETPFETACPQHLSDVKGIGSVYETRLYAAGVGTFWELSRLADDELKSILRLTKLQITRTDFAAIRADARRLAQETRSLGRKWMRCPPDDFEPMRGIGFTYEKRLYDAGVCTFEALASATVDLLEEICHAPARFKPDYASWIEQAKVLAAQKAMRQDKA